MIYNNIEELANYEYGIMKEFNDDIKMESEIEFETKYKEYLSDCEYAKNYARDWEGEVIEGYNEEAIRDYLEEYFLDRLKEE